MFPYSQFQFAGYATDWQSLANGQSVVSAASWVESVLDWIPKAATFATVVMIVIAMVGFGVSLRRDRETNRRDDSSNRE